MAPELEEAARMTGTTRRLRRRLALFSLPLQGHINPTFQLATLLFNRGFSITIVHTRYNAPDPAGYPDFRFVPLDDRLGNLASSSDAFAEVIALNARCRGPFRDLMARLLDEGNREGEEPVVGLVVDAILYSTKEVAEELGLRRVVLRTSSASFLRLFARFLAPIQGTPPAHRCHAGREVEVVPEAAPPSKVSDLIKFDGSSDENIQELVIQATNGIAAAAAVVLNTFEDLESPELADLQRVLPPVFPLGPLHKFSLNASSSLLEQDRSCMEWLDRQFPGSVIYVSFGSMASMDWEELLEVAWGLAGSRQPFLWVLRQGSVRGPATAELPARFAEETRGWGMVVAWAPQPEVLAHPAVGAFWTHGGWNSVMESLCEGVPMLCRPYFGDQTGNARYVSQVWKVGLVLDGVLHRGEVERAVTTLMAEEEGVEMRERARDIKEKAERCIKEGGSSFQSLDKLVDFILSP